MVINKKKLLYGYVMILPLWYNCVSMDVNVKYSNNLHLHVFFTIRGACQKSMEEEKKEHVEKAGDLLKWVSNLSTTLSKEGGEKAEKTDLPKQQVHRCVLVK